MYMAQMLFLSMGVVGDGDNDDDDEGKAGEELQGKEK